MKISSNTNNNITFKGIYDSKLLKKSLEFAAENGALFTASASLALSVAARPLAIWATPKTDKENKKYACAKSLASSAVGFLIMLCASKPVSKAIRKIDNAPSTFLNQKTIDNLKSAETNLNASKKYQFATQLFKLGLGLVIAIPKSIMTCSLIPPIMDKMLKKNEEKKQKMKLRSAPLAFKGAYNQAVEGVAKGIGKLIDTNPIQKAAKRFSETNFAQHIISMTDILATLSFVRQTSKNKKIEEHRKKPLIYNSLISTGLCLTGGYAINNALNKPTEKFIEKFSKINQNDPKLEKYKEGIKIAKPVLILGGIYYILIPIIATFLADRTDSTTQKG